MTQTELTINLAKWFHNTYEDKARLYKWATQEKSRVPFEDLPEENAKTMLAVCSELLKIIDPMNLVEPCEPDCDPVRHARHEGTWQAHLKLQQILEDLE